MKKGSLCQARSNTNKPLVVPTHRTPPVGKIAAILPSHNGSFTGSKRWAADEWIALPRDRAEVESSRRQRRDDSSTLRRAPRARPLRR
jgi:hypothetical protein